MEKELLKLESLSNTAIEQIIKIRNMRKMSYRDNSKEFDNEIYFCKSAITNILKQL